MKLKEYEQKRNLRKSGEPAPDRIKQAPDQSFTIHKHAASHLHYDLRLSNGKALLSWAIPKGLPSTKSEKHFAKRVEDHPLEYSNFEGNIPEGNYGAGTVMIYDSGQYSGDLEVGLNKGHISLELNGKRIQGRFSLIKLKDDDWLIMTHQDLILPDDPLGIRSVKSNKLMAEIFLNKKILLNDIDEAPISRTKDLRIMAAKTKDNPFNSEEFVFEAKLDGYRAIADISLGEVDLLSRNNLNFKEKFKIIYDELKKFKYSAVLDGEVVAVDKKGSPRFELLQNISPTDNNLFYYVFDILYFENHDLRKLPLTRRKALLKELIPSSSRIRYLDHISNDGIKFFNLVKSKDIEGVIAKEKNSKYLSGQRSDVWLKIKNLPIEDFVIVGYTEPKESREYFGSLVLARENNGKLEYFGKVGTGFSDRTIKLLFDKLKKLKSDKAIFDLKDINWLKPQLVARVRFLEKTSSGQLRHPSFVGLKEDENPRINFSTKNTEYKMVIEDQEITISNPDKIYFPEKKIRKIDLINYYLKISNHLLPFIVDRPQSLYRFPNGIYGDKFYQKNTDFKKKWIKTIKVKDTNYSVITNKASLAYIINLGCIEINPWLSKIPNIVKPDILAFDLDPGEEIGFNKVIDTALAIKNIFDQIGVKIFVKTSGASGLHIFVPLKPTSNYKASKLFAELIATLVQDKNDFVSLERDPNKRKDKVYIDFLQNNPGQTIASIYSIRPNNKALVSAPIAWKDLKKIKPDRFDIKTIFDQIEKNPWKDFFLTPYDISELYTKTKKLIKS